MFEAKRLEMATEADVLSKSQVRQLLVDICIVLVSLVWAASTLLLGSMRTFLQIHKHPLSET